MRVEARDLIGVLVLLSLSACSTSTNSQTGPEVSGARGSGQPTASLPQPHPTDVTGCRMPDPTMMPPLSSGGKLPAGPSSPPGSPLAVMLGLTPLDQQNYAVNLIDMTGHVVASAKAHMRSPFAISCLNRIPPYPPMPLVSTSAGRVYYLDGDSIIRWLAADGSTGLATTIPGDSQQIAMFAVSADDRWIAVAVGAWDNPIQGLDTRLYIEDLAGGGHHVDVPPSNLPDRFPIGWHAGSLVIGSNYDATVPAVTGYPTFGQLLPLPRAHVIQVLDRATGHVQVTIGSHNGCRPMPSLPTLAGFACWTSDGKSVGVIDWSGDATLFATGEFFGYGACVSLDGKHLLAGGDINGLQLISAPSAGGTPVKLGSGPEPATGGWIDDEHVVLASLGSDRFDIFDVLTGGSVALPYPTVLGARLPGGY